MTRRYKVLLYQEELRTQQKESSTVKIIRSLPRISLKYIHALVILMLREGLCSNLKYDNEYNREREENVRERERE